MPKKSSGFTLIELLIVLAIIAILAAVVVILLRPLELLARSRDAARLSDLEGLQKAVDASLSDALNGSAAVLCYNLTAPCNQNSNSASPNNRKIDGTGWVKINLVGQAAITVPTLPIDPKNDSTYFYTYYSDGNFYEFNSILESDQFKDKMTKDGGNNVNKFETGSSLTLIN